MKNYTLINRNTGKAWRKTATREEARQLKRQKNFRYDIVDNRRNVVVR